MGTVTKLLALGGAVYLASGLDNRLEVTRYKIRSKAIPKAFDGFRIVHISDFHCDPIPGLVEKIQAENPDIIAITGDLAHDDGSYAPFITLLEELVNIAPCFMVSGNHDVWRGDYESFVAACQNAGGIFLQDARRFLRRGDAQIAISGIEDPFTREREAIEKRLEKSLAKLPKTDGFDILLFHRANSLDRLKTQGFDLILAGHLHGGQFRIPGIGGVLSPRSSLAENTSILFPKYFGGLYDAGKTKMIVNRGIGNPMVIPRLFNRPEIGSITLESEEDV